MGDIIWEKWNELKETIRELRDNRGAASQEEICKFLLKYMGILEGQAREALIQQKEILIGKELAKIAAKEEDML